jgi:hypothetical protein
MGLASDRLSHGGFEPERQALASTGCEHDQVWILLVNLSHARSHGIPSRAHLGYGNPELLKDLEGMAPRLEHLPPCESFSNGRKFGPIFLCAAPGMQNDQLGFSDQRDRESMGKRQLARPRKIGGMENRFDKRNCK